MSDAPIESGPPRRAWWKRYGNAEIYIAATLFIYTWTIQTQPGAERSSMIHLVTALGLGTGFAVGGVRYADAGYKSLAYLVLSLYGLMITALIIASIIPKDRLIEFWRSVGIR